MGYLRTAATAAAAVPLPARPQPPSPLPAPPPLPPPHTARPGPPVYPPLLAAPPRPAPRRLQIYGFTTLEAAARAFDVLTCKRALEKGRPPAALLSVAQGLGTNLPSSDYQRGDLLGMLAATSRDDLVYGLKACAKKGFALAPE